MNDSAEQKEQFNGLDWMRGGWGGIRPSGDVLYTKGKYTFLF